MSDIKRVYPSVTDLVGNSIYVKASVLTKSGKEHEEHHFKMNQGVKSIKMQQSGNLQH